MNGSPGVQARIAASWALMRARRAQLLTQAGPRLQEVGLREVHVLVGKADCDQVGQHGSEQRIALYKSLCAHLAAHPLLQGQLFAAPLLCRERTPAAHITLTFAAGAEGAADELCSEQFAASALDGSTPVTFECRPAVASCPPDCVEIRIKGGDSLVNVCGMVGSIQAMLHAAGYGAGQVHVKDEFWALAPMQGGVARNVSMVMAYIVPPRGDEGLHLLPTAVSLTSARTLVVEVHSAEAVRAWRAAVAGHPVAPPGEPPVRPSAQRLQDPGNPDARNATAAGAAAAAAVPTAGAQPARQQAPAAAAPPTQAWAAASLPAAPPPPGGCAVAAAAAQPRAARPAAAAPSASAAAAAAEPRDPAAPARAAATQALRPRPQQREPRPSRGAGGSSPGFAQFAAHNGLVAAMVDWVVDNCEVHVDRARQLVARFYKEHSTLCHTHKDVSTTADLPGSLLAALRSFLRRAGCPPAPSYGEDSDGDDTMSQASGRSQRPAAAQGGGGSEAAAAGPRRSTRQRSRKGPYWLPVHGSATAAGTGKQGRRKAPATAS